MDIADIDTLLAFLSGCATLGEATDKLLDWRLEAGG